MLDVSHLKVAVYDDDGDTPGDLLGRLLVVIDFALGCFNRIGKITVAKNGKISDEDLRQVQNKFECFFGMRSEDMHESLGDKWLSPPVMSFISKLRDEIIDDDFTGVEIYA